MDATDLNLKLGLPGTNSSEMPMPAPATKCNKRTLADAVDGGISMSNSTAMDAGESDREAPPASK